MSPVRLRVRELREARGWSQVELAKRAGIGRATLVAVENGSRKGVDFATLEGLAQAFGVPPGYLIVTDSEERPAGPA